MAYIGLPPKANFSSGLLDRFTSTTGTTVTLTHDIASENDIVVFVNFVKQDSTTYSVGGTGNKTLTLGGTLVSSDIVEVHYLNIVGQTNAPSAGSVGSSQLTADVITGQTELASGVASTDELLISDAGTLKRVDVSLIGGNNTPAFSAYMSANQTISNTTITKADFDTEIYDSGSVFDVSNNRFTPGVTGKYLINAGLEITSSADGNFSRAYIYLREDGSTIRELVTDHRGNPTRTNMLNFSYIIDVDSTTHYYEIFGYLSAHSGTSGLAIHGTIQKSYFNAFKIIE